MSTSDILTQEEMDALLQEVESGSLPTVPGRTPGPDDAVPYNFASQERIIRGPMPTLEMIYDRFCRHFRSSLYDLLQREANVELTGVESLRFADYATGLPTHCSLHTVHLHPLDGDALFLLEPNLVFSLVDSFFGGDARSRPKEHRSDLTPSELRIARIVNATVGKDLEHAWAPVFEIGLEPGSSETNPHFVNIASPTEIVVVARIYVELGAHGGELHVTVPYSVIEPIRDLLDTGMHSDRSGSGNRWTEHLESTLNEVRVDVKGTLVEAELAIRDVLRLKAGDVIPVDLPKQMALRVEGIPMFRGAFGVARGHNAIKITHAKRGSVKEADAHESAPSAQGDG